MRSNRFRPATMTRVPPELIELIVDEVHNNSLKVCAFTASLFRWPAQKRIYATLRMTNGRDRKWMPNLKTIDDAAAHLDARLTGYVASLYFFVCKDPGPEPSNIFRSLLSLLVGVHCDPCLLGSPVSGKSRLTQRYWTTFRRSSLLRPLTGSCGGAI